MQLHKNLLKVFRNRNYMFLNITLALLIGFIMAVLLQFIFISPTFSIYIPETEILSLLFLTAFSLLSSFSMTMTIYMHRKCNASLLKGGSGFAGTTVGMVATACTCTFVIAPLILAGGSVVVTIAAIIAAYIIPLKIISLLLLAISVYFVCANFGKVCAPFR